MARKVMVKVSSDLYLPEWVIRAKARNELGKKLKAMVRQQDDTVTPEQLQEMKANDKVPGVYVLPPDPAGQRDYLIIPSLGTLSADEVRYLAGMVREGGYGKGPEHRSKELDWHRIVKNTVDYLVETRKKRQGNKVNFAVCLNP